MLRMSPDSEVQLRSEHLEEEIGQGDVIIDDQEYDDDSAELNTGEDGMNVRKSSSCTIKPEKYNGKESWDEYFCHFRCVADLNGWNDTQPCGYLSCSMVGVARRYLMTLSQPERRNFESLSRNLASRFSGEQIQIKWLKELENRVKRPDETLADLGDDLMRMAGKAHPNLPRDT